VATTKKNTDLYLDYPKAQERISSPEYTFRVGSKVHGSVEISVDGGPWQPCRPAAGYWWFDWRCEKPGRHKAAARIIKEGDAVSKTTLRYFHVGDEPVKNGSKAKAKAKNGTKTPRKTVIKSKASNGARSKREAILN